MAVPNTTTFTLQNVVDEVNPTTDDLVDCFADAISAYFNPTYAGSKNSLLNFRDYGSHNVKTISLNFNGGTILLNGSNQLTPTYTISPGSSSLPVVTKTATWLTIYVDSLTSTTGGLEIWATSSARNRSTTFTLSHPDQLDVSTLFTVTQSNSVPE